MTASAVVAYWQVRLARLASAVHRASPWRSRNDGLSGATREPQSGSFATLHQLLRVADLWPTGRPGTAVRRAACDLIETNSSWGRALSRRRLRRCIADVERRRAAGDSRSDDPSPPLVEQLSAALLVETGRERPD